MKAASSDGLTEEPVHGFSALSVLSCSIDCLCRAECIATGNRIFNRRRQRARRITGRSLTTRGGALFSLIFLKMLNLTHRHEVFRLTSNYNTAERSPTAHCALRIALCPPGTRHYALRTTHYAVR